MSGDADRRVVELISIAERLDSLAEIAELMGDAPTAREFRVDASTRRLRAMDLRPGARPPRRS